MKKERHSSAFGLQESYTWKLTESGGYDFRYPCKFSANDYSESFMWREDLLFRCVFLTLYTWRKPLTHAKVVAALGGTNHPSALASIAGTLEAGRRAGLYEKHGTRKQATFTLSSQFRESKKFRSIRFLPSEEALATVKRRAHQVATLQEVATESPPAIRR